MFHQSYLVRLFPHGFLPFIVSLMILITWNQKKDRYLPYSASTIAWIFGFVEMELKGIPIHSYCSALRICCLPSRASPIWARFCPCGGYGVCWYYLKTSVLTNRLLVRYVPLRFWPSESVYQQTPYPPQGQMKAQMVAGTGGRSICAGLTPPSVANFF